ncbi:MAG: hypothetical protein OJF62_001291 [Pseudolabrys sp.]|jgi:hypothetical protein|nr:hypothetical protein [Pseudolabrys sp.]
MLQEIFGTQLYVRLRGHGEPARVPSAEPL